MSARSELGIHQAGANVGVNMVLFAEPGTGKTPFIGTSERALVMDADGGETSLALRKSTADVVQVEDHDKAFEILDFIKHDPNHGYKWLWLDGITLYQEKGLEFIMENLIAGSLIPGRPAPNNRDIDLPDRGEYKMNYSRIVRLVRHMSALPVNFGITAHVMYHEGSEMHVPLIAGEGRNGPIWMKVCGYMGVVGYLRKAKVKGANDKVRTTWKLHCDGTYKDYYGKSWFDELNTMTDPTVPKIDRIVEAAKRKVPKKKSTNKRSGSRKKTTARRSRR